MKYFLHLAYDGTRFHGWQIQPNMLTVQQEVDRCLSQVLRQPVYSLGSGRTDSGVHASHQVAHFDAELPADLDLDTLRYRLNRALPPDVRAYLVHPVPPTAHARFDALARTYYYHVRLVPDPFGAAYALYLDRAPDVAAMNEAAALLVGPPRLHDLFQSRRQREALPLHLLRGRLARRAGRGWYSASAPTASCAAWCGWWWARCWPWAAAS